MAEHINKELACEDCIHYDICIFHPYGDENKKCPHFKNKDDVVEVVRCKDCEYSEMCFPCKAFGLEAPPVYVCCISHRNREVLPNDYCSCGAKMDGKGECE